jgi:glutathionyl-hydroquinone reductase
VTPVRFDIAYHGRRIADYTALSASQARVLAIAGVREAVSIDHIKRGYYSIKALNPTGIVPLGPELPAAVAAQGACLFGHPVPHSASDQEIISCPTSR